MIRRRMTLLVMAMLAVVIGSFSTAVFVATREAVQAEVRRDLANRRDSLVAAIGREPDAVDDGYVSRFAVADVVTVVFDADGNLLARSGTLRSRAIGFDRRLFESDGFEEVDDGGRLIVTGARATTPEGEPVFVAVGRSPDRTYDTLATLARVLVPGTLAALAITGLGVHLLLRRSLRPLEHLGIEASDIARSADHSARIEGAYRADEVGALAGDVDLMLVSLGDAHRRAEEATDNLRDFLADVSHELRAPLAVALSSLDLLARSPMGDEVGRERIVTDMSVEVERMGRIVSQLLAMARTQEDSRLADRPLLLGELAASAGLAWARVAEGTIDVEGLCRIEDIVVQGNDDELRQILDVLFDNAIRHTPPGGAISLAGTVDGDAVAVSVADTGVGISSDELPNIFKRFHRGDAGGTGLGLAIAQHIAQAHGGSIKATSEPGAGSCFTLTLPVLSTIGRRPDRADADLGVDIVD